eukprot:gene20004-7096_t
MAAIAESDEKMTENSIETLSIDNSIENSSERRNPREPKKKGNKAKADPTTVVEVPKHLFSRILYPNPVCFLTSRTENEVNVMTISWLTAIDNNGVFFASMNQKRHSASLVFAGAVETQRFTLSVPVQGMEATLKKVGGC